MRWVVLCLLLGLVGCADDPARAFEKFYDDLATGNPRAVERLSNQAKAKLDDKARAALLATPPKAGIKSVIVRTSEGNTATLDVVDVLGDKDEVRMVREDGAWRVDL